MWGGGGGGLPFPRTRNRCNVGSLYCHVPPPAPPPPPSAHIRLTSLFYRGKQREEGYRTERLAPCHNYCHYVRTARGWEGKGPPANVLREDVFGTSGRMFAWTRHVTWEFTMIGEIEVARRIWSTDSLGNALCDIPSTFVTAFVKFCFVILLTVDGTEAGISS